jgi:hypothetical protein
MGVPPSRVQAWTMTDVPRDYGLRRPRVWRTRELLTEVSAVAGYLVDEQPIVVTGDSRGAVLISWDAVSGEEFARRDHGVVPLWNPHRRDRLEKQLRCGAREIGTPMRGRGS